MTISRAVVIQLLYRGVRELPDTSGEWYRYRTRMQAELLARLRGDADETEVAAWMRGWPSAAACATSPNELETIHYQTTRH